MSDPFGRAILDHARGEQTEPLLQRDGEWVREHPIEAFYFTPPERDGERLEWLAGHVEGPLLDVGAGAGRLARHFQRDHETVAIEVSDALVTAMAERGVANTRNVDMFDLPAAFPVDRFRSVLVIGTQVGLAASVPGIRRFLRDVATVTTADASLVLDNYDPAAVDPGEMLGFRRDVTPGLGFRVMHFEYEGDVGETLLFRLAGPERLREATRETPWRVASLQRRESDDHGYYRAALTKP